MARGALIILEGLDRAGKSTQCAKLVESLSRRGFKVKGKRFPDRSTKIGTMINDYLTGSSDSNDQVIHLLFSANRWEATTEMIRDLEDGYTIIVDRYVHSGMVYSAAKGNTSLGLEWARKPDEGLPRPDVCIFLNITPEQASARGGYGNEKYENHEMQARVRQLFSFLRTQSPDRKFFVDIDGGKTQVEVEEAVLATAIRHVRRVADDNPPLGKLEPW